MLLPGSSAEQALGMAQRLCDALVREEIPHSDSPVAPHVTLSVGLAQLDPDVMDHFETLLHQADKALYRAKKMGRNQVAA